MFGAESHLKLYVKLKIIFEPRLNGKRDLKIVLQCRPIACAGIVSLSVKFRTDLEKSM